MQMDLEAARLLWESRTYSRFVKAYHNTESIDIQSYNLLLKEFISVVEQEFPEYYQDWDPYSFLLFDTLQQLCIDFFRQRCTPPKPLTDHISVLVYHIRLLKLCFREWAKEEGLCIDDEACEMFCWYWHAHHHHDLMDFAPREYHMGYENWREEIRGKWNLFLEYCQRGAHSLEA